MYTESIKTLLTQLKNQINSLTTEELIALYESQPLVVAQKAFNDTLVYSIKGSEVAIINSSRIKIDALSKDDAILVGRGFGELINKVAAKLDGTPYFDIIVNDTINNLEFTVE